MPKGWDTGGRGPNPPPPPGPWLTQKKCRPGREIIAFKTFFQSTFKCGLYNVQKVYLYCKLNITNHTVCQNGLKLQIHVRNLAQEISVGCFVVYIFFISNNSLRANETKKQEAESLQRLQQEFSHCTCNGNSFIRPNYQNRWDTCIWEQSKWPLMMSKTLNWTEFNCFEFYLLWYCKVMKSTLCYYFKNATKDAILTVKEFQVQGKNIINTFV